VGNKPLNEIGCHCDLPKRHLGETALFEASCVQIGRLIRPVHAIKKMKREKENNRVQLYYIGQKQKESVAFGPQLCDLN
jgi:hypothetical protein